MTTAILLFRQDLRLHDNPAFIEACTHHATLIPLYIYNNKMSALGKAQAWWLYHSLNALDKSLQNKGLKLVYRHGDPFKIILDLAAKFSVEAVYWNRHYEPEILALDEKVERALIKKNIDVQNFNGRVLNEPWVIKNKMGGSFKVFTPYWKTCRQVLSVEPQHSQPIQFPNNLDVPSDSISNWKLLPSLNWASGFAEQWVPGEEGAANNLQTFITHHLKGYKKNRDFPQDNATSRLSPHLHFGEISPWTIVRAIEDAKHDPSCDYASAEQFLSELGWREFSLYLLYHFPTLAFKNFRSEFDAFPWENDAGLLELWQQGNTGYPIVDAGMRELWATGYMHNRVRMIVASFLTKGLLIDWRIGADWFLDTLVDADLANNSTNWQWVAGSGVDAAPYFRIFNPVLQSEKFDPQGTYIRRWVPELLKLDAKDVHAPWEARCAQSIYSKGLYPMPIVNHQHSRARALRLYHAIKQRSRNE